MDTNLYKFKSPLTAEKSELLPREEGVWQLNVLCDGSVLVPLGLHWVGRCQDGGTSIQRTNNPSLSN